MFRVDWINKWEAYKQAKEALYKEGDGSIDKEAYEKVEQLRQEFLKADEWYHERAKAFEKAQRNSE
jgi:DNA-binding SARP family transcriptional activator